MAFSSDGHQNGVPVATNPQQLSTIDDNDRVSRNTKTHEVQSMNHRSTPPNSLDAVASFIHSTPALVNEPHQRRVELDDYLRQSLKLVMESTPNYLTNSKPPLVVPYSHTVADVLDCLNRNRLRCVVVARRVWRPLSRPRCSFLFKKRVEYSFFDVRDLCYHLMRLYKLSPCSSVDDILSLVQSEKVGDIANASKRVPFVPYQITQPLSDIVAAFVPTCRVPIFDGPDLVKVLAPSDLLMFLSRDDLVSQIAERGNIAELAKRKILTITESESLLKAVTLMERHGYSAIPIVSEQNPQQVLDVITVKDIKYLLTARDSIIGKDILNVSALLYVSILHPQVTGSGPHGRRSTNEWCFFPEGASLAEVFHMFSQSQIHRSVLLDDEGRMTGILSLTDTMKKLAELLCKQ